jgi:8-oxo-dGTP diphosphatase
MDQSAIKQFNIRVYGVFINDLNQVLLADEKRFETKMTKFPGGGLQFGEGTIDCLKREAIEEFGQEIEVVRHLYTTDFFQQAMFFNDQQLISVYYYARFPEPEKFRISQIPFDFQNYNDEMLAFRYKSINEIEIEELTFPIDQYVLKLLKTERK